MDPRQDPHAYLDAYFPVPVGHTQMSRAGVRVIRKNETAVSVALDETYQLPKGFEVVLTVEKFCSLLPWDIRHLVLEIARLPSLARGLDFAMRQSPVRNGAAALELFLGQQDAYERRLRDRFLPFFDAAVAQGAGLETAIREFTLHETGVVQRQQRRKPGRPPAGERPMTGAERVRNLRDRVRQRLLEQTGGACV